MAFSYERIAGQSAERLAALSDGIFAVAMTLLLLVARAGGGGVLRTSARPNWPRCSNWRRAPWPST